MRDPWAGEHYSDSYCTKLAQEGILLLLVDCFTVAGFDGMVIEALRNRGLSDLVIFTLVKARKSTFKTVYHCIWKAYFADILPFRVGYQAWWV